MMRIIRNYSNTKIFPSHEHEAITLGKTGWKAMSIYAWLKAFIFFKTLDD